MSAARGHCPGCGTAPGEADVEVTLKPRGGRQQDRPRSQALPPVRPSDRPAIEISEADLDMPTRRIPVARGSAPPPPRPPRSARPPSKPPGPESPGGRRRTLTWAGAAAAAVVVVGAVAFVLLRGGGDDSARAATLLISSGQQVRLLAASAGRDLRVAQLRQTGADAVETNGRLQASESNLVSEPKSALQAAGVQQVRAEQRYAAAVRGLRGLSDKDLLVPRVPAWGLIKSRIEEAIQEIVIANRALVAQHAPVNSEVQPALLRRANAHMQAVVRRAALTLRAWKKGRAKALRGRRIARVRLAQLESYESAIDTQVGAYETGRRQTQEFADHIDDQVDSATRVEQGATLEQFKRDRQSVFDALSALRTDDADLQASQSQMVNAVQTSISGLTAGQQAVAGAQLNPDTTVNVKDQPQWNDFQTASTSAGAQMQQAKDAWGSTVAARKAQLNHQIARKLPARPRV